MYNLDILNINIDVDNENNVNFYCDLPSIFFLSDEYSYLQISENPFYKEKNPNFSYKEFLKKFGELNKNIVNKFPNFDIKKYNIKFHLNSHLTKNCIEFLKKVNIPIDLGLNHSDYELITNNILPNECKNLKIYFNNSQDTIPYKEFYEMYQELNKIILFVNKYDLSQLEKVLLVYDIVKANVYKKEKDDENNRISRDLNLIIKSDKIVCEGYSNLLNFLLNRLGLVDRQILLSYTTNKPRHIRNMVYIKDDKYNIEGNFILDSTWDSKKDENYLDNYNFCLKRLNFFKQIPNEIIDSPQALNVLLMSIEELNEWLEKIDYETKMKTILTLNSYLGASINLSIFTVSKEKFNSLAIKIINEVKEIFNKKIPKEVFKNALYKVRRIEYINGIFNKNLTEDYINEVCSKYYKDTSEIKLLKALNLYKEPTFDIDLKEINSKSIKEDSLRIRFLKDLKEYINDIPNDQFIKRM